MKWLRCDQELPAKDGLYIVYAPSLDKDSPFIQISWYNANAHRWELIPSVWAKAITHFMFLPDIPKEKK